MPAKLSQTQRMTILTKMANEILQAKKNGDERKAFAQRGTVCYANPELQSTAWDYSFQFRMKSHLIEKIEPVVKRGRNGKFEGVEITYIGENE